MVLGSCNFNFNYNNSKIERNDCFKLIDYFYSNGGRIIDSAANYHSHEIIKEWLTQNKGNELKIITKVWKSSEIVQCFEELEVDKLYCIMARNSKDNDLLYALKDKQKQGLIEKVGISIYYQEELIQNVNAFHVPPTRWVFNNIETMELHSDIYIRSFWNYNKFYMKDEVGLLYKTFKQFDRPDLNHQIEAVVGVDNLEQLKEDMEIFK